MNTHINKNREKPTVERSFKGITITAENYREIMELGGRHELNYHARHLEAYLKGKEIFRHGFRRDKKGKVIGPAFHKVQQEFKAIE